MRECSMTKAKKIKFTCASSGETAQTIRTAQLGGAFKQGETVVITLGNGQPIVGTVNRKDGSTMYIPGFVFPNNLKKATV